MNTNPNPNLTFTTLTKMSTVIIWAQ